MDSGCSRVRRSTIPRPSRRPRRHGTGAHGSNTLDTTTIVKLTRTLAIIPITLALAVWRAAKARQSRGVTSGTFSLKKVFPFFILFFVLASVVTTVCTAAGHTRGSFFHRSRRCPNFYRHGDGRDLPEYQYRQAGRTGGKPILMGLCCWVGIACVSGDAARAGYLVTAENAHKKGPSGANCRRRAF